MGFQEQIDLVQVVSPFAVTVAISFDGTVGPGHAALTWHGADAETPAVAAACANLAAAVREMPEFKQMQEAVAEALQGGNCE